MNPQSVFVDPLLTSVYVGYTNAGLIADKVAPRIAVSKESGLYFKSDKENLVAPATGSSMRALNGTANRVMNSLTADTFTLVEHTFEHWIDDRILKTYDNPFDPRRNAAKLLKGKMELEKEAELISVLATATASGNVVDSAGNWATAGTDLRSAMNTGKNYIHVRVGMRPNTLILDQLTLDKLVATNTDFKASIAYTSDKTQANLERLIAGYFDVENVIIASGIKTTAATAGTGSFVWSTKGIAYLAYINPTPAIEEPSALYQLYKEDMVTVDVRREEGAKSDVVRSTDFYVNKVVDSDCLYKFLDTVTD